MMARIITFNGNTALNFSAALGMSSFNKFRMSGKKLTAAFPYTSEQSGDCGIIPGAGVDDPIYRRKHPENSVDQ